MPAELIQGELRLEKHSIVGSHSRAGGVDVGHVGHVGLLSIQFCVAPRKETPVNDMRPPLSLEAGNSMASDVAAWLADLSVEEVRGIDRWLHLLRTQVRTNPPKYPLQDYTIFPYYQKRDPVTGRSVDKYSCVGFVIRAYEQVRIILIKDDNLPAINREVLESVYGETMIKIALRKKLLEGDGPWRILLPGYVMHALAQPNARSASYSPQVGDWSFPRPTESSPSDSASMA